MGAMQFLASLPAVLGLAGFVVMFLLRRNRNGDRISLDVIAKLRREAPDRLPEHVEKLGPGALTKLIESDVMLRSKISDQDFQLLRDALRQQFVTSLVVYAISGIIFVVGVALYTYVSIRPVPVSLSSLSAESADPVTGGVLVDLYPLRVRWSSAGDPEDITALLEDIDNQHRTSTKTVRSTEGRIDFGPDEYRDILANRSHGASNRLRAVFQSAKSAFVSPEMEVQVGTEVLAVLMEPTHLKIIGIIDNSAIPYYNFDANFLCGPRAPESQQAPLPTEAI